MPTFLEHLVKPNRTPSRRVGHDQNSDKQLFGEHLDPPEPLELSSDRC